MKRTIIRVAGALFAALALTAAAVGCGGDEAETVATETRTDAKADAAAELAFDRPMAASDPFNDPSGPYFHQVMKATSPDGLNFTRVPGVVLNRASVPDIIRLPSGRLIIYAVDGGDRSESGLMVAVSDDDGESWKQGSLQVEYKGDHRLGVDPEAVVLDDGSVRLYYVVFPQKQPPPPQPPPPGGQGGTPQGVPPAEPQGAPTAQDSQAPGAGEPVKVMSALSSNGIDFEEEEGSRLETTELITDPDVVRIDGQWYMYVSQGRRNVAYSSFDGMEFTVVGPVREDGSVSNTVPAGGGQYRQYFCRQGIRSALSGDGVVWVDDPGVRLAEEPGRIACDPAPIQLPGGWLMFYKSADVPPPA
ncbi:MAG: hypothetical protein C4534_09970 [Gaiellales bacterium]|nr:MAG: hypothetical protein C4534_09970 [Gaiellales bacterium]